MSAPAFHAIIPARYESSRLPGKPLSDLLGRPMILHVAERARASGAVAVHVATDDDRIREVCVAAGVNVVMTRRDHGSGTERLAEACHHLALTDAEIVVNVQGDEPLMPPSLIAQVAALLDGRPDAELASLCHRIEETRDLFDPAVVKVVFDIEGRALYFSRAPIPWDREGFDLAAATGRPGPHFRHIGLYAYRVGYLARYVALTPAPAERCESLEQLRALHHGATVLIAQARETPGPGVDTVSDLERVRRLLAERRDRRG